MITVREAKQLMRAHIPLLDPADLSLEAAAGLVVAEDIFCPCDIPAYRQSSMDGYAIQFTDRLKPLKVCGMMKAGTSVPKILLAGQAFRVFTGAPLPEGADTVVIQEKVVVADDDIRFDASGLCYGDHVRHQGAEGKAGQLVIRKGTCLSPAAVGFVAGLGISRIWVYPRAKVSIVLTGDELAEVGRPLAFGQVYESNSPALTAALRAYGIRDITLFRAPDDLDALQEVLGAALAQADLVLLTGGVSVGDYDFVLRAAERHEIRQLFYRVRQKPGKPLYLGLSGKKVVFGLPGNPSSVMSCFYNYVLPAVAQMSMKGDPLIRNKAKLASEVAKPVGLTQFLKGRLNNGTVTVLGAQESYRLSSFAEADCLICLDERETYAKGEIVEVLMITRYAHSL